MQLCPKCKDEKMEFIDNWWVCRKCNESFHNDYIRKNKLRNELIEETEKIERIIDVYPEEISDLEEVKKMCRNIRMIGYEI